MRIPRIYSNQSLAVGQQFELDENASRHIAKVLRMEEGRPLVVFNGQGGEYEAILTHVGKKRVEVKLEKFSDINRNSPLSIHLGISVSRGDRMDLVLQKATELGVTNITPLFTERTEVKLTGLRLEKKIQHWQQVIVSACEQCQLNLVPKLEPATKLDTWLSERTEPKRFVLHHRTDEQLDSAENIDSVALLTGPEGGLSQDEIKRAETSEFQALRLGQRVLRTETAPIMAVSILQYLWGDLS